MNKACEFLRECGSFFVLTRNGDFPNGRPFGAVTDNGDKLLITTSAKKEVYRELKLHKEIIFISIKPGTRIWARFTCEAHETDDLSLKEKMLKDCPNLKKYHERADEEDFRVFEVSIIKEDYK